VKLVLFVSDKRTRTDSEHRRHVVVVVVEGIVGGVLCNWSQQDGVIPVNKNLWYAVTCAVCVCVCVTNSSIRKMMSTELIDTSVQLCWQLLEYPPTYPPTYHSVKNTENGRFPCWQKHQSICILNLRQYSRGNTSDIPTCLKTFPSWTSLNQFFSRSCLYLLWRQHQSLMTTCNLTQWPGILHHHAVSPIYIRKTTASIISNELLFILLFLI